jgi:hypothetical protein
VRFLFAKILVKKTKNNLRDCNCNITFALAILNNCEQVLKKRRGARVVMEQIANLSTGDCRQGSSPCLSAKFSV